MDVMKMAKVILITFIATLSAFNLRLKERVHKQKAKGLTIYSIHINRFVY